MSEKPITVGWGKKETQFHGSQGKPTAADVQEVVSVIFFSTWCNILVVIFIPVYFKSHRENYIQCFYFEVLLASTEGYFKYEVHLNLFCCICRIALTLISFYNRLPSLLQVGMTGNQESAGVVMDNFSQPVQSIL